jgi:RNA polymerase sigma-70 factor (ECF subfamily)
MTLPLVDAYLAVRAAGEPTEATGDRGSLGDSLVRCVSLGRAAWPDLPFDETWFVDHLALRVAPAALETAHAADLWLACACTRSVPGAVEVFERAHGADVRAVHAQSRPPRPPLDELQQVLRARLFVGPTPKIADYSGSGPLRSWVRVVGARVLVDLARAPAARETPRSGDDDFLAVPSPAGDPELEYLKRTYRVELRQAFEEAARALSPEERNVLREHYAHGLSIDEIAAAHGIHRATAARRIEGAREAVLRGTRQRLMRKLRLSRRELESVVRLIESQLHVTIDRVLRSGA